MDIEESADLFAANARAVYVEAREVGVDPQNIRVLVEDRVMVRDPQPV